MRRNEGIVGGVIFIIGTLLAFALSGCDEQERRYDEEMRERGFKECEKLCGARPVAVQWDRFGSLTGCRCDVVIATDVEVE